MKIIAKDESEKQDILKISKYLHDFRVYRSRFLGKVEVLESVGRERGTEKFYRLKRGDMVFLDLDDGVGNYLRHLYLNPDEVTIEEVEE